MKNIVNKTKAIKVGQYIKGIHDGELVPALRVLDADFAAQFDLDKVQVVVPNLVCVAKSSNTNSFGLYSFIFFGLDGNAYQGLGTSFVTIKIGHKFQVDDYEAALVKQFECVKVIGVPPKKLIEEAFK